MLPVTHGGQGDPPADVALYDRPGSAGADGLSVTGLAGDICGHGRGAGAVLHDLCRGGFFPAESRGNARLTAAEKKCERSMFLFRSSTVSSCLAA